MAGAAGGKGMVAGKPCLMPGQRFLGIFGNKGVNASFLLAMPMAMPRTELRTRMLVEWSWDACTTKLSEHTFHCRNP